MTYGPIAADSLAALPQPQIIVEPGFEAELAAAKTAFRAVADAEGLDVGDYIDIEAATETILLEEAAYARTKLRADINEFYRSRLIYFGTGADLDNDAEDSGVTRLEGEGDAALRTRVRLFNRGSSSAGPDDWWKYHAMTADPLVQDVAVTRPNFPIPAPDQQRGVLTISILADTLDGVPSQGTLDRVSARLNSSAVRGACCTVNVVSATSTTVNIAADVWLMPTAAQSVFTGLEDVLRQAWGRTRALGWDVSPAWITAALMQPGVQRVENVTPALVRVRPDQAPRLGSITLNLRGRDY